MCKKNEIISEIFFIMEGFCLLLPSNQIEKLSVLEGGEFYCDINLNSDYPLIYNVLVFNSFINSYKTEFSENIDRYLCCSFKS